MGTIETFMNKVKANRDENPPSRLIFLAAMDNRRFPRSTELYLSAKIQDEVFYVAVGCHEQDNRPIGYLKFVKVGSEDFKWSGHANNFELQAMLPGNSIVPSPLVSLRGVLWTRQEAAVSDQ